MFLKISAPWRHIDDTGLIVAEKRIVAELQGEKHAFLSFRMSRLVA